MTSNADARTEEGFVAYLKSDDPSGFAAAVADFSEVDRKKLSKCAQQYAKDIRKADREGRSTRGLTPAEMIRRAQDFVSLQDRSAKSLAMAHLGLLAVGPKSSVMWSLPNTRFNALRIADHEAVSPYEQAAIDILLSRRPDWAQAWFEQQLIAPDFTIALTWGSVKRLFHASICQPPDSEAFARLIRQLTFGWKHEDDPELVNLLWIQFFHNTGFWTTNGPFRKFTDAIPEKTGLAGPERVYRYVFKGLMDRAKVIDHILQAFWRDFNALEMSGLTKLYEALEVTPDEILARQSEHCRLLACEASPVVTLALKCLKSVKAHAGLDIDATIQALSAVMVMSTKTQPIAGLALLKSIVGSNKSRVPSAVQVAAVALQHPDSDVKTNALELLEKWSTLGKIPTELLSTAASMASPLLRTRIEKLLPPTSQPIPAGSSTDSADTNDPPSDNSNEIAGAEIEIRTTEVRALIDRLPNSVCNSLRLTESLHSALEGKLLPEIDLRQGPFPKRTLVPVAPIRDVEQLIDAINAVAEKLDSPMDIERILDGLHFIGQSYPNDFDLRVAAIKPRLQGDYNSWVQQFTFGTFPLLFRLMLMWLQRFKGNVPSQLEALINGRRRYITPPQAMVEERIKELEDRLIAKTCGLPLLSLPSYEHGWLEPAHLLERIRAYCAAGQALPPCDFELALLRLLPGNRYSRDDLGDLPESIQRVLLYASGEPAVFTPPVDKSTWSWTTLIGLGTKQVDASPPQVWLAAGRSRNPSGSLPELKPVGVPEVAFGTEAPTVVWHFENCSTDRELAVKEVYELRKKHSHSELLQMFDPNQPGLEASEIQRRARMKAAVAGRQFESDSAIVFQPTPTAGRAYEMIPITLTSMTSVEQGAFAPAVAQHWYSTYWPSNCDGCLAASVTNMFLRYDSNASSMDSTASTLAPLLWPELAWTELARQTIWLAVMCKSSDASAVGKDALIEGLLDGRAQPGELARSLIPLLANKWLKLNRLADALTEVARVSLWATLAVNHIVEAVVQSWTEVPRDGHLLLNILLEGLAQLQSAPSQATIDVLNKLKSTGKAAKLAQSLLRMQTNESSVTLKCALIEAVEARASRGTP